MLPIPLLCTLSSFLPVKEWPSRFLPNKSRSESDGELTLREGRTAEMGIEVAA